MWIGIRCQSCVDTAATAVFTSRVTVKCLRTFLHFTGRFKGDCNRGDCFIVLSQPHRVQQRQFSEAVRTSRLPVHYVFVTEKRTGAGGKAEVAQNLLRRLDLKDKACLFDDNLEMASEFCNKDGTIFQVKEPGLRGAMPDHCNSPSGSLQVSLECVETSFRFRYVHPWQVE